MFDAILRDFLIEQEKAGFELAANSDILTLEPDRLPGFPPMRYTARFKCIGVLLREDG